jgi:hypothetical protein
MKKKEMVVYQQEKLGCNVLQGRIRCHFVDSKEVRNYEIL